MVNGGGGGGGGGGCNCLFVIVRVVGNAAMLVLVRLLYDCYCQPLVLSLYL